MRHIPPIGNWAGLVLALAGFGLIWAAWDGASDLDYIQGQFPYLISGGIAGLGLITVGVGLLVIEAFKRDGQRRARELQRLGDEISQLHALLAPSDTLDPEVAGEYRPRPRRGAGEAPTEQIVVPSAARRGEG